MLEALGLSAHTSPISVVHQTLPSRGSRVRLWSLSLNSTPTTGAPIVATNLIYDSVVRQDALST